MLLVVSGIFYLPVGGPGAASGVLMVGGIHIGRQTAVVALEAPTYRFHHIGNDGCIH